MADYGLDTTREGAGLNYCGLRKNARDLRRSLKKRDKKKPLQDNVTLRMRWIYGTALYRDTSATLDDLREAVTTLEDAERISRRVMGGAHPTTEGIEDDLQEARAALNAELRAAFKEDPSSLSADDRARAEQLLARDARKAAKKAARRVSSETPSPGTA